MKKVLILGANGQIAKLVTDRLLKETDDELTLYLRNSQRIGNPDPLRVTIVEGDVNDFEILDKAMAGQDIVYANLGGEFEPMAKNIVQVMEKNEVSRLIYVTGLGLYHEVPGEFGRWVEETIGTPVMDDTRRAAAVIEDSTL
ncbi:MAG TPA: short-chain dehydrogenase, partial [Enterococcus sp.]|nr:short-chain dehydrogenase [Enterococcus sp.]